jgi:hypothetical protein
MEDVKVKKAELLATLRTNKQEHQAQYDAALIKYREKLIEELEKHLDLAKKGKKVPHHLLLTIPEVHVDAFETAIQMLEWEVDDEVSISMYDFQRFVQNEWEWSKAFHANTTSYLKGR